MKSQGVLIPCSLTAVLNPNAVETKQEFNVKKIGFGYEDVFLNYKKTTKRVFHSDSIQC